MPNTRFRKDTPPTLSERVKELEKRIEALESSGKTENLPSFESMYALYDINWKYNKKEITKAEADLMLLEWEKKYHG